VAQRQHARAALRATRNEVREEAWRRRNTAARRSMQLRSSCCGGVT